MDVNSLLTYRFFFGALGLLLMVFYRRQSLNINLSALWRVTLLAALYDASAVTMVAGYNYMPTGVATTIQFSYPIFTPLLMFLLFRERLSWRTVAAIVLAVGGVVALTQCGEEHCAVRPLGVVLELIAGLTYAIYLVLVPVLKVGDMDSSKLTFYIFAMGAVLMMFWSVFTGGGVATAQLHDSYLLLNLVLLGLIPTALSNITLILALKRVGSTMSAILGALEPLTAMVVGIVVLGEPFTALVAVGFVAIIASVMLLTTA